VPSTGRKAVSTSTVARMARLANIPAGTPLAPISSQTRSGRRSSRSRGGPARPSRSVPSEVGMASAIRPAATRNPRVVASSNERPAALSAIAARACPISWPAEAAAA
jgi:hypothetical protein